MPLRNTLLYNSLGLPAYWKACRKARAEMEAVVEKVRYGEHRRQYVLVVKGRNAIPGRYAFYFHGGAWTFGQPESFVPAANPWLELGFTVVLPSYRRPPQVGLDGVVNDCRAAIGAIEPAGQVTHLHAGGISAGAHLTALLSLHPEWWKEAGWPGGPQKALLCAGPLSLELLSPRAIFRRYAHLDPCQTIIPDLPDLDWQLLHGTHDGMVDSNHSENFYEKLLAAGHSADLHILPGGTHLDAGRWMFGGQGAQTVRDFLGAGAGAE
ncbi:alpha/beta hydrolase [Neolewinella aurantiaca]|uniref:Alpha/beta hydrolase n=1 Tax=Neolewinella aurantiaca TaxID=2602767 RepID=A0A5C7F7L6_9BACT|nr:alpha/beta hydrolase [Neolewinella aurantiaca]TXF86003.1 alpha/beta hydrolase [Neolewinella aurantiaca]